MTKKRKTSPIASLTGVGLKSRSRIRVKSTFPLISGSSFTLLVESVLSESLNKLKRAIASEPVLKLPEFYKPFKVETDASERTIGGVLVQEGRPVVFESWKLNETEQRFTVHEKEMTALVHCLRLWRNYLLGGKFEIQTDNVAMSYFDTQKKLTPKQDR